MAGKQLELDQSSSSSSSMDAAIDTLNVQQQSQDFQEYEEEVEETSPSGRRWVANVDKPFRCPHPHCSKAYKQLNGLKYHKLHGKCKDTSSKPENDAEYPFRCYDVDSCGKTYRNANGLRYHYQHSGNHGKRGLSMLADGTHPHATGRFRSQSITSASGSVSSNIRSPLPTLSTLPEQAFVISPPKSRSLALPMQSMAISSNSTQQHSNISVNDARDSYRSLDENAGEQFMFSASMPSKSMFGIFPIRTPSSTAILSTSAPVRGSLDAMMAPARARMLKRKRRQSKTARDPSYNGDGLEDEDDDGDSSDLSANLEVPPSVAANRIGSIYKSAIPPEPPEGLETLVEIDDMEMDTEEYIDPDLMPATTDSEFGDFGTTSGITSGSSSRAYTPVTTTPLSGTEDTAVSILLLKAVNYVSRRDLSIADAPLPTRDLSPAPIAHRAMQGSPLYDSSGYGISSVRATHHEGTTSRRASF